MVVILDLVKMISHHSSCGGLNEKCPLSLHYLNTCHPVGGAVWGRCSLLEEVCLSLGWALRVQGLILLLVCSFFFLLVAEDVICFLLLPPCQLLAALLPLGNVNPNNLSLLSCLWLRCFITAIESN